MSPMSAPKLSGCSHCAELVHSSVVLHPSSLCECDVHGVAALGGTCQQCFISIGECSGLIPSGLAPGDVSSVD